MKNLHYLWILPLGALVVILLTLAVLVTFGVFGFEHRAWDGFLRWTEKFWRP